MSDLANLQQAMVKAAQFVEAKWKLVVMGAETIPQVPEITSNIGMRRLYADSITIGTLLNLPNSGQFRGLIITAKEIARDMEFGKGPWDMKPMLLNGPKARVGKNGKKFNIIPFRHGTSDKYGRNAHFKAMPKDIYGRAKELKAATAQFKSRAVPKHAQRAFGEFEKVYQRTLRSGQRLTGAGAASASPTTGYQHKSSIYEGMSRVQAEGARGSQYMTFRRVSEESDPQSWWHPGYEAMHIAKGVAEFCRPDIEAMFREAAVADMVTIDSQSVGIHIKVG